ncbi:DUF11 domain-containing protein [Erythrobacter sp. F6033]|uniref:DUF11 domain-containing protein n=1 Tax=Erythrobacter sp. F6033 TaxID=2926401 RepID=UPI001FF16849|nr:DUF11 domain-containing protein [Erythrobacter sp. F6033]MCK0127652.1 DUF11 domain-containing protein [Erythrobacter sp. F6033]
MMNLDNISADKYAVRKAPGLPVARMLTSALPFVALAVPGAAYAQSATNTATITAPAGATDSDLSNNSATDTDTIFADIAALPDDFSGTPILSTGGSTATVFTNDTLNSAGFADTDVIVSILDDDGITGVSIASDGTITVPNGTTPGTYNVRYQICEAANPTNCADALATIVVGGVADLVTAKTLSSASSEPAVGDTVTFEIVVTNNGGDDATNVTLTDSLPAGLTATLNNGNVTAGTYVAGTGVWTIPTLANGASATLTIEGVVDAGTEGTSITNTTTAATGDQTDPTPVGDDLVETVTVINTIIANNDDFSGTPILSTGGSTATVFTDDTLNNAGFADTDVIATIVDDDGLTGVTIGSDGTLTVPSGATPGTYNVEYQICEAADTDNCDTAIATVVVGGVADLVTVKTLASGTSEPAVGATVTFEIVVTNNGGNNATNVTLTDSLPAGLIATLNNGNVTAGTYVAGTGVWTIPTLANGASATLTIEGVVDSGTEGTSITNVTTAATSDENDPTPVGDDLDETVTVINTIVANDDDFTGTSIPSTGGTTPTVFTDDTLNNASFAPADVIPTITNDGGLTGVTINPDGSINVPSGATPGTYSVTYQICEVADTDNCDTATVDIAVGAVVDLSITKTNTPGVNGEVDQANDTLTSGQSVTYTLVVTNSGPDAAVGAVLTDNPGTGLSCPVTNPVNFTGSGTPSGSFTIGDLTGSGITLGTLLSGESATITYTCTVD